jgi:cysteine desulfurase/selenocysteine lyase
LSVRGDADNVSPLLDVEAVRRDFPILSTTMNGRPLVFLDNGATTQKPRAVIDAVSRFYETGNANIHRGVYSLSQQATAAFDDARQAVARFINAPEAAECIFVRGVTEAINLVAHSWARPSLEPGDEILLTALEHHSNIVPWQMAAQATGASVRTLPMTPDGELEYDRLGEFITPRTRLVAMQAVSNALGTVHDVPRVIEAAKAVGAVVLIDGAQHVGHFPTDVAAMGCDFFTFSGHKLFGPTGVGVLWGRRELLDAMPPFLGGGDMIESVGWSGTTYAPIPAKFEAGTPDIAGVIGLGAAIGYVLSLGWPAVAAQEEAVVSAAVDRLSRVPGLRIVGTSRRRAGAVSFVIDDPPVSSLDIGMKLDRQGIAVRTGHHCAQPLMDELGIAGTTRASFAFYNTLAEVEQLGAALEAIVEEADMPTTSSSGPDPVESGDYAWPEPTSASPTESAADLVEDFTFLKEAGEDPRDFVLDLGKKLPPMPGSEKNEATHVKGCMSQVWITARRRPGTDDGLDFLADSDAEIVKGLIGVLQHVFAGQSAKAILAFDVNKLLADLDLQNLISVQRRSGVEAMLNRIMTIAKGITGRPD